MEWKLFTIECPAKADAATVEGALETACEGLPYRFGAVREVHPAVTEAGIRARLDEIELGQTLWEDGQSVMTFNGKPIGGTIHDAEIARWWFALKLEIAEYLGALVRTKEALK